MADRLDFRKLRYVVAVAQTHSLTGAAKLLSITQPALTRCIAEVEEDLGVQLFVRLRRGVSLTEEGEKLVNRAQVILADLEDLEDDFRQGKGAKRWRLRVGAAPGPYLTLASDALASLASAIPEVDIATQTGRPKDVVPRLETGELDLLISTSTYLEPWPELPKESLTPLQFAYMVRKGHPVDDATVLSKDAMERYPAILPASVEGFRKDFALLHDKLGLPPLKAKYITDDFELIFSLLNSTDAYFPIITVQRSFDDLSKRFSMLKIEANFPPQHLCMAYPKTRGISPVVSHFIPILRDVLQTN